MTEHFAPALTSPCTGVCRLDRVHGWCLGCARTGEEIARWGRAPALWRDAVWAQIPARLARLGVSFRRLPLDTRTLRAMVADRLASGKGRWVMGPPGARTVFEPRAGEAVDIGMEADAVTARTPGGALRIRINEASRPITWAGPDVPAERAPLVLAVKREAGRPPLAPCGADLGPDKGALLGGASDPWVDLGLGRKAARLSLRAPSDQCDLALTNRARGDLCASLHDLSGIVVMETPLGRMEVALTPGTAPQIRPNLTGQNLTGPHLTGSHLTGPRLNLSDPVGPTGRDLPEGMDLPAAYLPGALFLPEGTD